MDEIINKVESEFIRDDVPEMSPGDKIRVHEHVKEGSKERIQVLDRKSVV